ncbi:MAG: TonB-dependent receptor [Steroidobacteraceae bacterium]
MSAEQTKRPVRTVAGVVALAMSAGAYAAVQDTTPLEQVVVTATATPVELAKSNTGLVVISGEEIERNQYKSLYDILERVPGFNTPLYADGVGYEISGETSPTMRGSTKVVVLVDGVRQNVGTSYKANALSYNTADVERVEVLRGSASVLYGADAVGGVVNIITKRKAGFDGTSFDTSLKASFGDNSYRNFAFANTGTYGRHSYWSVDAQKIDSGNFTDGQGVKNPSNRDAYGVNLKYGFRVNDRLDLIAKYQRYRQDMDWARTFGDQVLPWTGFLNLSSQTYIVDYHRENTLGNQLSVYYGTVDSWRTGDAITGWRNANNHALGYTYSTTREIGKYKALNISDRYYQQLGSWNRVAAGLEYTRYESATSATPNPVLVEKAAYLQDEMQLGKNLKFTAGVRHTRPDDFKGRTIVSGNLGYMVGESLNLYVSSNGFYQTPSLTEIFGNGVAYLANPNIKPSNGRTDELGFNWQINRTASLQFDVYRRSAKDAIAAKATGSVTNPSYYWNIPGTVRTKGLEANLTAQLPEHLYWSFGFAQMDTDDETTIIRFPKRQATMGLTYARERYDFGIQGVGRFAIVPTSVFQTNNWEYLPQSNDYWLWNLSANWRFYKESKLFLKVNNLFDLYYMPVVLSSTVTDDHRVYMPAPGRNFVLGVEYRF